ncbi:hypothetical protein GJ744_012355 [Endocarpon pusillum]|uniref:Uncharacterized protein n=1 Tax=Endocarpon pusillum TaxID=364733 RepID=A0A8H7E2S3_9EURO|nr:hypothetical protein GJ744_012355 [Endocarpon pusillum]
MLILAILRHRMSPTPTPAHYPTALRRRIVSLELTKKMQGLLGSAPDTAHWDWTVIFRENSVARVLALHENIETWTRAPHVATAYVQDIFWWDPTWFLRFRVSPNGRVSVVKSQAANVRTACLWQNVTINTIQVQFPLLELYRTYFYHTTASVTVKPEIWSQDNACFVDPDLVRTIWIDGAQSIEAVTAGLVVLGPLASLNETMRPALACSIDARWGDSNHIQSDGPLNIAITADVRYPRHDDRSGSGFLPANDSHWKHIKASMAWLDALTPTIPYQSPALNLTRPASTIANLLMSTGHIKLRPIDSVEHGYKDAPYQFWESLIATYFADGVARVGYSRQLSSPLHFVEGSDRGGPDCIKNITIAKHNVNTCPEDRPKSANLTAFSLEGQLPDIFAYRASAKTDFASIAIILVYVCIATTHFFYCLISRRSSRAWEKLEDLLALAHSSRPDPSVLSNTSAGMKESSTKAKTVRIVVMGNGTEEPEESDKEERMGGSVVKAFARNEEAVQMRFVESMRDGTTFGRVEARTKYGKMD